MFKITSEHIKLLSDTHTPVSVYLKLRDKFPNSILLESSDYHSNENSFSYVCCEAIASIKVDGDKISERFPDDSEVTRSIDSETNVVDEVENFKGKFEHSASEFKFVTNGLFGYINFSLVALAHPNSGTGCR